MLGRRRVDVDDVSRTVLDAHLFLERLELGSRNVQVPLQVATHFPLHLVDFLQRKHFLRHDAPRLVRIGVVADDFAGNHKGRDE